jgi:hypothetical protein
LLQRLLLLPLLTPLLAVLLVAALNPRPSVSLRVLTWRSPSLPLGGWIAAAAAGGAGLSTAAAALALGEPSPGLRRRGVRRREAPGRFEQPEPWAAQRRERQQRPPAAGPSRAPGEPAPTVSVPFRVVRRASGPAAPAPAESVAVGDGWSEESGEEW